jgi:type III pantothenate kinase
MQLVIDIGNTLIKSYVFEEDQQVDFAAEPITEWKSSLKEMLKRHAQIKMAMVADVNRSFSTELKVFLGKIKTLHCSMALKLPFKSLYDSNTPLGSDRIALLAACCLFYPKTNVLVIDLGSCITYDLMSADGVHHGGSISPGFGMRYRAMNSYSGTLPALDFHDVETPMGKSTEEAMHTGVYFGIVHEVEGMIKWYEAEIENLTVILTGGDAERLPKPFKNGIFAHSNFLAKGLNHILALNTNS